MTTPDSDKIRARLDRRQPARGTVRARRSFRDVAGSWLDPRASSSASEGTESPLPTPALSLPTRPARRTIQHQSP